MSLDTQVALARPPRAESSHLSRAARQVVPPFLQKLYEIVNDPANEELIRWSDTGDSFYVLNHEKFAREVLGRWFKHQKFASFVRQLNMYGFHKIPHLQQGVLKSDTDTEPWHFEHPNFHRGQPDLLCLIQRKKQPAHGAADEPALDVQEPVAAAANGIANVSPNQLMDINSIVSGIAVIKRHQQAISSELSALKQSNDALWKESVAARQRHAKHQDTINRILKFLAGVFGHTDDAGHSSEGSHTPPQVTPRIRQRLMIGGGSPGLKGRHVDIAEVEDDEADLLSHKTHREPFSDRYATIESADTAAATPSGLESIAPSEAFSPRSESSTDKTDTPPVRPSEILSRSSSSNSTHRLSSTSTPASFQASTNLNGQAPLPGTTNGNPSTDAMWQAAIQHMMQSPQQFQRIMQAFASQQQPYANLAPEGMRATVNGSANGNASALSPYDAAQADYGRWLNPPPASGSVSGPGSGAAVAPPPPLPPVDESPMQLLLDESSRLQKSYQSASEINADMDMLQTSINSLIQDLGIDPGSLATTPDEHPHAHPHAHGHPHQHVNGMNGMNGAIPNGTGFPPPMPPDAYANGMNGMNGMGVLNGMAGLGVGDSAQPDYLLDSLLSQISSDAHANGAASGSGFDAALTGGLGGDYRDVTGDYDHSARIDGTAIEDASTEQLTAFLDEASSASSEATPAAGSPLVAAKRKSDVMDVPPLPTSPEAGGGRKVKRKR